MSGRDGSWVLRQRLARQRLTGAASTTAGEVVALLTAVQSQDVGTALWSLGQRTSLSPNAILTEQSPATFVRTHILRPTWHYVSAADLRWMQRLTGPRMAPLQSARHRQLGLEPRDFDAAVDALGDLLTGQAPLTRRELTAAFAQRGLPSRGEQMAHQLIVAESRAVLVSGPPRGQEHTYVLASEHLAPAPLDDLHDQDAVVELTARFFAGHGPADERDLARWSGLPLTPIRRALQDLTGRLARLEVDDHTLWFDESVTARGTRPRTAFLLPTFDEACLTYPRLGFPRAVDSDRSRLVAESGGGVAIVDLIDVGRWRRTLTAHELKIEIRPDTPLDPLQRSALVAAAEQYALWHARALSLEWIETA